MKSLQKISLCITLLVIPFITSSQVFGFSGNSKNPSQNTINWGTNATSLRGQNGQRVTYTCPGGGSFGRVWGTDVYTDDSSICTAAVHAGRINAQAGGAVTIEIRAGQSQYNGSTRYGVTSANYGAWQGSYIFIGGQSPPPPLDIVTINWDANATSLRGQNGRRFTYICAGNGRSGRVWGTDIYTDDSSICTAALHAGLINAQAGGKITLEIRAGQSQYTGTTRYGVTSTSYGAWHGSYVFIGGGQPPPPPPDIVTINWATNVTGLRGQIGKRVTYRCPGNGTFARIWGTDVYTDDSSVCTAAVHAGLISPQSGGTVTLEMRAGQSQYGATTRNGVSSTGYGAWQGSYVFIR